MARPSAPFCPPLWPPWLSSHLFRNPRVRQGAQLLRRGALSSAAPSFSPWQWERSGTQAGGPGPSEGVHGPPGTLILDFSLQNHETILFVISSYSVCGALALRKQVHSLNECLQESHQTGTALISPIYRLSSPPISNLHVREGNRKLTHPSHGLGSEPGTDSFPSCPDFIPDISGTSSLHFSS